jgi:hypothetical protein
VRKFVEEAFAQVGKEIVWRGSGVLNRAMRLVPAVFWSRSIRAIFAGPR